LHRFFSGLSPRFHDAAHRSVRDFSAGLSSTEENMSTICANTTTTNHQDRWKIASSVAILSTVLALGLLPAPAQAQLARTFVSAAGGNDANDCNRATPCRTFQVAHNKTFDQGEITVLDPGGYGAVTITKSISIVNDGVGEAGVLVSGGAIGITINAPAGGYVNLRGLTIQGIGFGGGTGLRFNTGFSLTITNCVIRNNTGNAVEFFPSASSNLSVSNTLVADNGGRGIFVRTGGGAADAKVVLSGVEAYNNSLHGFVVDGSMGGSTIKATVADSTAANNSGAGIVAISAVDMLVVRSVFSNNASGIVASASTVRVGQSTVTGSTVDSWVGVQSYGDNMVNGNADGSPAMPTIAKK
jgi:hypothetical protein